jgi:hypothetical protein
MTLPLSGQLSLNDIKTEVGAGSTNVSLGAMSDTAGFSAPDKVSDFYGYAHASYQVWYHGDAVGKPAFGCEEDLNTTVYHNGTGLLPAVGDTCTTAQSYSPMSAGNYPASTTSGGQSFQVITLNSLGVCTAVLLCQL